PTSGTVRIGEEELSFQPGGKPAWKDIQRLRGQTGMVFQNFQRFPHRTAGENVMEGLVTVQKWPAETARAPAIASALRTIETEREGLACLMAAIDNGLGEP
ncbi:hypothetical protein ABTI85_19905, partial [Acinetobacter baumannii]